MPLYVHEVEARLVSAPGGEGPGGLSAEQFRALVTAVARELERARQRADSTREDAKIRGSNRPPSVGT